MTFTDEDYLVHARRINAIPNAGLPCEIEGCGKTPDQHDQVTSHAYHRRVRCDVACKLCDADDGI